MHTAPRVAIIINNPCERTSSSQAVTDPTGREDLLVYLRRALLLQQGEAHSCHKIVVGTTASAIAVQIIAETSKVRKTLPVGDGGALTGSNRVQILW